MKPDQKLSQLDRGHIAISQAIASFVKRGYQISVPLAKSGAYNLIVDTGNTLKKVQVRYTSQSEVDLRSIHSDSRGYKIKKPTTKDYDWLFIYQANGEKFLIKEDLAGRRSITPGKKHSIKHTLKDKNKV